MAKQTVSKKKTTEEFKQEVYDLVGDEYKVLGEYVNNKEKIKMRHNKCNTIYEVAPNKFLQGRRCSNCSGFKKKTTEIFKQEVYDLVGDEYKVLGEYVNNQTKIEMLHIPTDSNIKPHKFEITPVVFLSKKLKIKCPKCKLLEKDSLGRKKSCGCKGMTHEEFKNKFKAKFLNNEYILLSKYKNDKTKIKVRHNCKECNYYEYEVRPSHIMKENYTKCPVCSKKIYTNKMKEIMSEKAKTHNEFLQEVYDKVGLEYTVLGIYNNCKTLIKMRHNSSECNYYEYEVRPRDFLTKNNRCPKCFKKSSGQEKDVRQFLENIYKGEIIYNDRKILNGYELDIYVPELNMAFEFDGLYWHSELFKDKNYHLNKTLLCEEKGIQLIHIFEDEWVNNKEIIQSKIKHLLKCNNNGKIYARKCYVEEISSEDKNQFLNGNHIQGKDQSKIKLGLWYPEEDYDFLVAVMTFCKPRKALGQKSNNFNYELSRFATSIDYQVIGAFGKLWKYFENNYEFNNIITYADRRWSKGNVYEKNGFKLDHVSKPSYWYINTNNINKREYRYAYRKSNLKKLFPNIYDDNLTESEIMKKAGYIKIWDCGNLVYTYKKEKEN